MIAKISDAMMREQSRTTQAFWLYICEHKELPPRDSVIARHLARAWTCDPIDVQHIGICNKGIDLIREAVRGAPDAPSLADAIAGFEVWLRASDAHRATFVSSWEMDEGLRAALKRNPGLSVLPNIDDDDPTERAHRTECLRIEREVYMRHRYPVRSSEPSREQL